jgi:5-phospho-D-xylono-1,4-lactonase
MIQTVRGPIKKEQRGFSHSHEHLFLADGQPAKVNPSLRIDSYSLTVEEMFLFKQVGGNTIVDAQPLGCGRMEEALVQASMETGINIIASTGFHKLAFYPEDHWIFSFNQEQLADVFKRELTEGMYVGTDRDIPTVKIEAKAGLIKTAIDEERVKDKDKKWFYAAAEAAVETGFPIMCHTESESQAVSLAEFYLNKGVSPNQIIVCHLDRTLNGLHVHKELGEQGIFLEYDTIGRFKYHNDEEEAKLIIQMLEWGLEDKILLGLDTTRERMKSYGGDIGLDYIKTTFIPLLKSYGVTKTAIEKMMVHNPFEAFSRKK